MWDVYLWFCVRYAERNPVRAGIVDHAQDYRWSSAAAQCGLLPNPVVTTRSAHWQIFERINTGGRNSAATAGLTQALGQILIEQRNQLPNLRAYHEEAALRETAIAEATLQQIRYVEEARWLQDLDGYASTLMLGQVTDAEQTDLAAELHALAV